MPFRLVYCWSQEESTSVAGAAQHAQQTFRQPHRKWSFAVASHPLLECATIHGPCKCDRADKLDDNGVLSAISRYCGSLLAVRDVVEGALRLSTWRIGPAG